MSLSLMQGHVEPEPDTTQEPDGRVLDSRQVRIIGMYVTYICKGLELVRATKIVLIFHMFIFYVDINGNFHVRDVGGPNDIWAIPTGENVVVEFNMSWQPTATSRMKFGRLGDKYVRSGKFMGISDPHWKRIPKQNKEDIWIRLIVCRKIY